MQIQVAAPPRIPRLSLPAAEAAAAPAAPASLPTTVDLTRDLAFGESTVDEAGVVLAEMSVLVYRPLDLIRRALEPLKLDACTAMDAGRDRDADWRWLQIRAAVGRLDFSHLFPLTGAFGSALSPLASKTMQQAMARQDVLSPWRTDPKKAALPTLMSSLAKPDLPNDEEWALRNEPPRVLALLQDGNALLVFRGTATAQDWRRDFSCWPARALPLRHHGFEKTWQEVKPGVEAWLQQMTARIGRPPNVYLGGHSLGGAVATLAAADFSSRYAIARVVTLGCPRVGGWRFREQYARCPAAPTAAGTVRRLPEVSTRWVHGLDLFATLLPPPGPTAHVVAARPLTPRDKLDVQAYLSMFTPDPAAIVNPVIRGGKPVWAPALGLRSWQTEARRGVGQIMFWLATSIHGDWWFRLFLPLLPILAEQAVRSGDQHKSGRYLDFMPPTALSRAMAQAWPGQR